jgi:RNA polymerase-binding transcription factor DksA
MADHADVKAVLEAQLEELLRRAGSIEEQLSSPGNPDWEENAVESEDDEVLAGLGDLTKHEISEVRLALSRIESGQYEKCTRCGQPIPTERLAAIPYATTCIRCA